MYVEGSDADDSPAGARPRQVCPGLDRRKTHASARDVLPTAHKLTRHTLNSEPMKPGTLPAPAAQGQSCGSVSDDCVPAGIVVTPEGGIRAEPAAPRSSASVVLGVLLRTLGLGVLVVIYGALCVTIGFGPFVWLLVAAGTLKILMPESC